MTRPAFPTHPHSDPPAGGLAPEPRAALFHRAPADARAACRRPDGAPD
jgi:hypothetical protein